MNVVLTGSHGFIGSRLKHTLEHFSNRQDINVLCVNRKETDVYNHYRLGDYILDQVGEDFTVIHTAAVSDTKKCEENKEEAFRANVTYTHSLAQICKDFGNPIIFLSSDQVYDYFSGKDHYEYSSPNPPNYYGLTKLWAENIIREINPCHYILRLTWQYDIIRTNMPNKGIIYNIVDAIDNGREIRQSRKSHRYITWVNATIFYIIRTLENTLPCGIYNIASVTDKNCYDLYKWTFNALGLEWKGVLKSDSKLPVINLTPYPYSLKGMGAEIITYEDTLKNIIKDLKLKKGKK